MLGAHISDLHSLLYCFFESSDRSIFLTPRHISEADGLLLQIIECYMAKCDFLDTQNFKESITTFKSKEPWDCASCKKLGNEFNTIICESCGEPRVGHTPDYIQHVQDVAVCTLLLAILWLPLYFLLWPLWAFLSWCKSSCCSSAQISPENEESDPLLGNNAKSPSNAKSPPKGNSKHMPCTPLAPGLHQLE